MGYILCIEMFNWWRMACGGLPFRALVVLYRVLKISTLYGMVYVWDTVSPRMFLSTEVLLQKLIGQVNKDIPCNVFIYQTNDNQQWCSRLSNWYSLRCLGPCMNHLPPVWWSTFRFSFLNESWCVRLIQWRGISHWFLPIFLFLYITKDFPSIFLSNDFTLK